MRLQHKLADLPTPVVAVGGVILVIGGFIAVLSVIDALGLFPVLGGLLLALFVLGLVLYIARVIVSLLGLGRYACRMKWHWWRDFKIHERIGFASRVSSYLAVHGTRIHRCRTCGVYSPPEGEPVVLSYEFGTLRKVGGGIFTSPKLEYVGGDYLPTPPRSQPEPAKPPPLPLPPAAEPAAPPPLPPTEASGPASSEPQRGSRIEKWVLIGLVTLLVVGIGLWAANEFQRRRDATHAAQAEAARRAFVEAWGRAEQEWRNERADVERRFMSVPPKLRRGMDSREVAQIVVPIVGKPDKDDKIGDEWHRYWEWSEWDRWNWKGEKPRPDHCFFTLRLIFAGRDGGSWKVSSVEEWKSGSSDGFCKFQNIYPPPPPKEYEGIDGPQSPSLGGDRTNQSPPRSLREIVEEERKAAVERR